MQRSCTDLDDGVVPGLADAGEDVSKAIGQRHHKERCVRPQSGVVVKVDSSAELPSEPDSGFAGSSSCVTISSVTVGASSKDGKLEGISKFHRLTPCDRAILGPC